MRVFLIFAAVILALTAVAAHTWVTATDRPCPPRQHLVYVQGDRGCRADGEWGTQP